MLGFAEMAIESLESGHPVRGDLDEIGRASSRVALLAQSLEMFGGGARRGERETVDLNMLIEGLERDLRFVLQPGTKLRFEKCSRPARVQADPAMARMTLLLLACNAEDASAPGSTITFTVTPTAIRVSDTGIGGMTQKAEPFAALASTKNPERGVGLGLHAAQSAMKLQGGDLALPRQQPGGESGAENGCVIVATFAPASSLGADWVPKSGGRTAAAMRIAARAAASAKATV
jgi:signal transduction histidine kinase